MASKINAVVYTDQNAYGYYQTQSTTSNPPNDQTGAWVSQQLIGDVVDADATSRSIIVLTTNNAYSFGQPQTSIAGAANQAGSWQTQTLSGTPVDIVPTH